MPPFDISVIIPVYNANGTVIRSIQSVLDQTYKGNVEVIIIDDGSTDNSYYIVKQFIEDNKLNNYTILKQENQGVSKARNVGLQKAKGEWIALLDSDDEWLPDKLERQMEVLKDNDHIDFLGTTRNDEHFIRVYFKKINWLTRISPKLLLYKFIFVVPTVIFKRKILETVGYFDENQRYAEEGNYFIRICSRYNCYLLNESYVITGGGKAHFGSSGLSGNLIEMERGELKNLLFAYKLNIISVFEYLFLVIFSLLKYIRRILIVRLRL